MTFSGTWPKAGIMRDGVCWRQPMWERHTCANGSGLWPTPTANDTKANDHYGNGSLKLSGAVAQWRTPMASDWKNRGSMTYRRETGRQIQLQAQVGGKLNPQWVEWLMGYQIGWTALRLSETP